MAKFKLGELAKGKPMPESVYQLETVSIEEFDFESGAWGFKAQFKVVGGDQDNRRVFENFVVQDQKGAASGAAFRFAQFVCAAYGTDDIEADLEDKPGLAALADGTVGKSFMGEVRIEAGDVSKGYQDKNRVAKYSPIG